MKVGAGGYHRLGPLRKGKGRQISVSRNVIQAFDRSAKTTVLDAASTSDGVEAKLKTFMAGLKWPKNLVKRQNLQGKVVHGEAGSVNEGLIKEGMGEI